MKFFALALALVVAAMATVQASPQPSPAPALVKRQSLSPAEKSVILSQISGYLTNSALSSDLNVITEPQYFSSLSEEYVSIYGSETGTFALQAFTSLLAEAKSESGQASPTSSATGNQATMTADSSQSAQATSFASAASSVASAAAASSTSSSSSKSSNAATSLKHVSKAPLLAVAGLGGAAFVFFAL